MTINELLAPNWYNDAKKNGASQEALRELVRDYCAGIVGDSQNLEDVVTLTLGMYEGNDAG